MNKVEYLDKPYINDFTKWLEQRLRSFEHSYTFKKGSRRDWNCNSIFNAFKNYQWSHNGIEKTFDESQKQLFTIKNKLSIAIKSNNEKDAKEACLDMLIWGGLEGRNESYINNNSNIIDELNYIRKLYDPDIFNTNKKSILEIKISSGFSKIYSILFDNFIIYDSRVSAALCYFIRLFCEYKNIISIPDELTFAFGEARNQKAKRNPNKDNYKFSLLNQNNYLLNNIKASWLFSYILKNTKSKFNDLPEKIQLRALEAAFFMIGYEI